jgi:hypothetical protein
LAVLQIEASFGDWNLTRSLTAKTNRLALGSNVATDDEEFPSFGLGHQRKDELQQTKEPRFSGNPADAGGEKGESPAACYLSSVAACSEICKRQVRVDLAVLVEELIEVPVSEISSPSDRRHQCFMHGRVSSSCSFSPSLYTIADGRLNVIVLRSPSIT